MANRNAVLTALQQIVREDNDYKFDWIVKWHWEDSPLLFNQDFVEECNETEVLDNVPSPTADTIVWT